MGLLSSLFKKNQHHSSRTECKEILPSNQPTEIIIDDFDDQALESARSFYDEQYERKFDSYCTAERQGARLKVTMSGASLYEVAVMVNLMAWGQKGLAHYPKARYHVGKIQIGETLYENTETDIYIAEGEEIPSVVNLSFCNGKSYQYDLCDSEVESLD